MSGRKDVLIGQRLKIKTGCGSLYLICNEDGDIKPVETFITIGKAGGCAASQAQALGRTITLHLRNGGSPVDLVHQLRGIGCHMPRFSKAGKVLSCADAVGQLLQRYLTEKGLWPLEESKPVVPAESFREIATKVSGQGACPECGGQIRNEEGCRKCVCGYTEC